MIRSDEILTSACKAAASNAVKKSLRRWTVVMLLSLSLALGAGVLGAALAVLSPAHILVHSVDAWVSGLIIIALSSLITAAHAMDRIREIEKLVTLSHYLNGH